VYRLGCNRSFVSIIDRDSQFIIAEATKSVSLRITDQHLPDDGIYLGARRLDLEWGVCPHTIRLFTSQDLSYAIDTTNITANQTRYIIRDFRKEDCFKDRPYVREWPHMRFYAEVPLFSPSGYVLGSYCVVDDSPREEFGDAEVALLQEVSDAIALHLENTRSVHYHRRAEDLVKGLTSFVKDYAEFDPRQVSTDHRLQSSTQKLNSDSDLADGLAEQQPMTVSLPDRSKDADGSILQSSLTSSEENPSIFSPESASGITERTSVVSQSSDRQSPSPGEEKSLNEAFNAKAVSNATPQDTMFSVTEQVPMSDRIATIFARASGLLTRSMNLYGVAFLDAARCNPSL
jgi:GAF domain-containing protein